MFRTAIICLVCVTYAQVARAEADRLPEIGLGAVTARDVKSNDSPRANTDGVVNLEGTPVGEALTDTLLEEVPGEHRPKHGPLRDVDLSVTREDRLPGLKEVEPPEGPIDQVKAAALAKLEPGARIFTKAELARWKREMQQHQIDLADAALAVTVAWRIKRANYTDAWIILGCIPAVLLWAFWPEVFVYLKQWLFFSRRKNNV